jgi:hypothetical protein
VNWHPQPGIWSFNMAIFALGPSAFAVTLGAELPPHAFLTALPGTSIDYAWARVERLGLLADGAKMVAR